MVSAADFNTSALSVKGSIRTIVAWPFSRPGPQTFPPPTTIPLPPHSFGPQPWIGNVRSVAPVAGSARTTSVPPPSVMTPTQRLPYASCAATSPPRPEKSSEPALVTLVLATDGLGVAEESPSRVPPMVF